MNLERVDKRSLERDADKKKKSFNFFIEPRKKFEVTFLNTQTHTLVAYKFPNK